MQIKRVSIIGISASGKSIFSRKLSEQTKLPLFHMDVLFWKGAWEEVPEQEYLIEHQKLISNDEWIIEGYIDDKMSERLTRSDLIIFLDYPGWLCCWQLLKRWFEHRKNSRPELPKEAVETFDRNFFWTVLTRKERIPTLQALKHADSKKLVIAHWPNELKTISKKYFQFE